MNVRKITHAAVLAAAVAGLAQLAAPALGQADSTLTYQGRLDRAGEPYSGTADVRFTLWDAQTGGSEVAGTSANTILGATITDGLLTTPLDFGAGAFGQGARFVQVEVRTPAWDGAGTEPPYTTLDPRQAITATPYALSTRGVHVDEDGRVGVGNTSPERLLHVGDNTSESDGIIRVAHREGSAFREWDFGIGDGGLFGFPDNFGFRDLSGGTIMTLESSGQGGGVGIGTTNPVSRLDVRGNVRATGNSGFTFTAPGDDSSGLFSYGSDEVSLVAGGNVVVTANTDGLQFADGTTQTTAYRPLSATTVVGPFSVADGGRVDFFRIVAGAEPGMAVIVTPPYDLREYDVIAFAYVDQPGRVTFRIKSTGRGSGPRDYSAATWRITVLP